RFARGSNSIIWWKVGNHSPADHRERAATAQARAGGELVQNVSDGAAKIPRGRTVGLGIREPGANGVYPRRSGSSRRPEKHSTRVNGGPVFRYGVGVHYPGSP